MATLPADARSWEAGSGDDAPRPLPLWSLRVWWLALVVEWIAMPVALAVLALVGVPGR